MKYMGSKNRIAKYILPIILKDRKPDQWYVEPFVGGANMIDKVDGNRIGSDVNTYLIKALKVIKNALHIIPKDNTEFTERDYKTIKSNPNDDLYGYVGFALSYGGKWFGGWCRDSKGKRDYIGEAYRNAVKQSPKLKNVILVDCPYDKLNIPSNSVIYCDPPYDGTTKYTKGQARFNHEKFWEWCRQKVKEGHEVFISEYNAPDDFKCLWQKEIVSSLAKDTGSKKGIEKLFTYEVK